MSALPDSLGDVTPTSRYNGDDGDVASDVLGIGYSDAEIELIAEAEELDAFELRAVPDDGAAEPDDEMTLPDEGAAQPADVTAEAADIPEPPDTPERDDALSEVERETPAPAAPPITPAPAATGLVDQPSNAPSRKVKAAGLGGLIGAIPGPLLAMLDTVTLPESTVGAISAALTLLGALSAAWLARERDVTAA